MLRFQCLTLLFLEVLLKFLLSLSQVLSTLCEIRSLRLLGRAALRRRFRIRLRKLLNRLSSLFRRLFLPFKLNINRRNKMLLVMLWPGGIDLQVSLLHQVFIGCDLSARLHVHLVLQFLQGLVFDLDKRVMILLKTVLVLVKLFFVLIKLLLGIFELLAHFLFLLLELRVLLHKWFGLLKLLTLLLLLLIRETDKLIVEHVVALGILVVCNDCELVEILLDSWLKFLLQLGHGLLSNSVGINDLISELDLGSNGKVTWWCLLILLYNWLNWLHISLPPHKKLTVMRMTTLSLFLVVPLVVLILSFLHLLLLSGIAILDLLRLLLTLPLLNLLCLSLFLRLMVFLTPTGLLRLLHLALHLLHLHLLLLSSISSWRFIVIIMAHLSLIWWLMLLSHRLLLLLIIILIVFLLLVLDRGRLAIGASLSLRPSELVNVLLLLYHLIVIHVMIVRIRNLSKHRWRILLLSFFVCILCGCTVVCLFDCDSTITRAIWLILLINLNILCIANLCLLLRLMIEILKIVNKFTNITKVHCIFLLSLPSLFLFLSLLINLLLELFLFESFVFFFFGFLGVFFLFLLLLCLFFNSLLLIGLTLQFRLSLCLFFFLDFLLLSRYLLLLFFFNLLVHDLLGEHLRLLLSYLSSLLLCKKFCLLLGLLGQYLLPLLFLSILQLLGQPSLGLSNRFSFLPFLFLKHFLLVLPLLLKCFLRLLFPQLLLPQSLFPLLACRLLMHSLQLLLFISLICLGHGNLLGLFLKSYLCLLIQLSQFLSLVLHFLCLLNDLCANHRLLGERGSRLSRYWSWSSWLWQSGGRSWHGYLLDLLLLLSKASCRDSSNLNLSWSLHRSRCRCLNSNRSRLLNICHCWSHLLLSYHWLLHLHHRLRTRNGITIAGVAANAGIGCSGINV